MKTYKSVNGFIKGVRHFADYQEMSDMKGWDKISEKAQNLIYALIAGVQNDISELENILNEEAQKE